MNSRRLIAAPGLGQVILTARIRGMEGGRTNVRFGSKADINDMSGWAATACERYVSGSAFAPHIQERSTGSDYKSPYCLPKQRLYGSSLRTSDTGSPNTHYRYPG